MSAPNQITKADLAAAQLAILRTHAGDRRGLDLGELLRLRPIDRVAELLSREFTNEEIAEICGYGSARSVNAIVQRIRGRLGRQAV